MSRLDNVLYRFLFNDDLAFGVERMQDYPPIFGVLYNADIKLQYISKIRFNFLRIQ